MRDSTRLDIYFHDDKTLFLIPLYQRKYSWQQKHCQRLFADLLKVHDQNLRHNVPVTTCLAPCDAKSEPVARKSDVAIEKSEPAVRNFETTGIRNHWSLNHQFVLPWSHYQILTHVKDSDARSFYEIEAFKQQWSKRQLQRQIGSGLYERLALSRDKDEVMRLATEGQVVEKPADIIKDPLVLEFCGLKPDASYSETDLVHTVPGTV